MQSPFPNTLMDRIIDELAGMIMREFSTTHDRSAVHTLVYNTLTEITREVQREFAASAVRNRTGILDPTNGRKRFTI